MKLDSIFLALATFIGGVFYQHSVITGGRLNVADGDYSVVSGGNSRSALYEDDWVAGSLFEDN